MATMTQNTMRLKTLRTAQLEQLIKNLSRRSYASTPQEERDRMRSAIRSLYMDTDS